MAVTYNANIIITRSTQFDRMEYRKLALTSGIATEEFSASFDLTRPPAPPPAPSILPIAVVTPNVISIKFLVIQVTGGKAFIRLSTQTGSNSFLDFEVAGTLVMSGIDLTQVLVLDAIEPCYIEIYGMGI